MKKNNFKKNKKGFVVLFTVLIVSLILLMTIGISGLAVKEIELSGTARDAHYAFFSADSGAECALFLDRKQNAFSPESSGSYSCNGKTLDISKSVSDDFFVSSFVLSLDSEAGSRCANVKVTKTITNATIIESLGYNVGCNDTQNPLRIERAVRVRYGF